MAAAPDIFTTMLPALVGFCGVILGGILQVLAKHRADRYAHMMELRRDVADLIAIVSGFAVAIVQSAVMIDGVRNDFKERLSKDPKAEVEMDQDYLKRLGEEMFSRHRESVEKCARLLVANDERIADHVGDLQLKLANVINEVGYMHTGTVHIPEGRAKEIQADVMERINILVNMIAPRRWERFLNFRSAKSAKAKLEKEKVKARAAGFNVGHTDGG